MLRVLDRLTVGVRQRGELVRGQPARDGGEHRVEVLDVSCHRDPSGRVDVEPRRGERVAIAERLERGGDRRFLGAGERDEEIARPARRKPPIEGDAAGLGVGLERGRRRDCALARQGGFGPRATQDLKVMRHPVAMAIHRGGELTRAGVVARRIIRRVAGLQLHRWGPLSNGLHRRRPDC
jgi:hypothetical protein